MLPSCSLFPIFERKKRSRTSEQKPLKFIRLYNFSLWFWTILSGILLFMALNYHAKAKPFTYQSQIWADKAGYNIYLPLVLLHANDPSHLPDSIVSKTGLGFTIDTVQNKLITKYTCGVAILQLPFFLGAHTLTKITGGEPSGFSSFYQKSIDFAAVFYCVFGLILLWKVGKKKHPSHLVLLALLALLFGTNLLYYGIDETGMSHVYSFFLFSLFLFLLDKTQFLKIYSFRWVVLLGLTFGLITLIRPINALILLAYFFWNVDAENPFRERVKRIFQPKIALISILGTVLVWFPQLLYWKFTFGSWLTYSYGKESFNFWHPVFGVFWFSAKQGVFLYGSLLILPIIWVLLRSIRLCTNALFYIFIFLIISYLSASWHDPSFGCSFGARNLVEYQALFLFPLAELFNYFSNKRKTTQFAFSTLVLVLIVYNILLVYGFGGCSLVSDHWAFGEIVERMDL